MASPPLRARPKAEREDSDDRGTVGAKADTVVNAKAKTRKECIISKKLDRSKLRMSSRNYDGDVLGWWYEVEARFDEGDPIVIAISMVERTDSEA